MSKLDKDTVINAFIEAYKEKHGKAPEIDASGGWYAIDGGKKVRLSDLDRMTQELVLPSSSDEENTTPKKKKNEFSVKDFYAEQILAKYPGSKSPR